MKKINEPREKIQLTLTPNLIKELKIKAINEKITMREAVTRAITSWLANPLG